MYGLDVPMTYVLVPKEGQLSALLILFSGNRLSQTLQGKFAWVLVPTRF